MKRTNITKISLSLLFVLALTLSLFAGCSSTPTPSESPDVTVAPSSTTAAETTTPSDSAEKIKVSIGIGNSYPPFCYLNEEEELTGYDYECLLAVQDLLSDKYEFVFTADGFSNLLIGLDTGTFDIAVHHFGYKDERAENYLYAGVANMYYGNFLIGYLAGRTDITDMKSLAGKTFVTTTGSLSELLVLAWNEENPDYQILIEYAESGNKEVIYTGMVNGLYDAYIATKYDLDIFNEQYDNFMEYADYKVTPDDYNCGTYFMYSYASEELQQDIDAALQSLIDDGTLSALSIEWLGDDYTVNPNK